MYYDAIVNIHNLLWSNNNTILGEKSIYCPWPVTYSTKKIIQSHLVSRCHLWSEFGNNLSLPFSNTELFKKSLVHSGTKLRNL